MSRTTALVTARRGTVALSIISFAISYIALADLAHIAGLGPQAYLWPVMIDGTIVVGTVAVFAAPDWHSWPLLVAAAAVSVVGNGIHAWVTQSTWIAVGVALTPPIFLLWVTHLTVRLGRLPADRTAAAEREEPAETPTDSPMKGDPERRRLALQLVAEGDMSLREIASQLGVSDTTVRRWRDAATEADSTAENEALSLVGVSS
ncbi:sigma-70 region 4 domain-containing protein [Rhodococcus sp. B10]|uniref:DUF2637 domain-containing protein n=1 Tax=Rhodococcus sp. B10 TaxID=2695876 RepID=UPI001430C806|nr:sigma-70 region 4 domain-containing protein [Rhodococcus sp. B10]NIL77573.1 hypothetical protein [Rhodococcus sp. B10]